MPKMQHSLKQKMMQHIQQAPISTVWTPLDFQALGSRAAVDKALQRLVANGELRRIDRGLYDRPLMNSLTQRPRAPDYRQVIEAIGRRDQIRILIDGITAANDLGLTNAVPGRVIVHTDAKLRLLRLGNLNIHFKLTAPSKLYWVGHPAMRVVQALYWLRDCLKNNDPIDQEVIKNRLIYLLRNSKQGSEICRDLQEGLHTVPIWMQKWIKELLERIE